MSSIRSPSDLFGVPLVIRRQDATQLVHALGELWNTQTGRSPGPLAEDLEQLFTGLFNPRTSGARIRKMLDVLSDAPTVRSRFLNPPLIVRAGSSVIVTPEGRAVYSLLREFLDESSDDVIGIDPTSALSLMSLAYDGYRNVAVRRLHDAVQLLSGEAEGLRLPSIGLLLLLLINGSTTPESAIQRPQDSHELGLLDASVAKAIGAFADSISPGSRDPSHFSLYSGYAVTEARRRFAEALGPSPNEIYVDIRFRDAVIKRIARELRRPRRSPRTSIVMIAFDNLVSAYRAERPTLASLGITHESRADTAQLRRQLELALGNS